MRRMTAMLLMAQLAACNIQETPPQTQIDRLRVLSVQIAGPADPAQSGLPFAELQPGDAAALTPLVLAPGIAPLDDMTATQDLCLEDYRAPRWDRSGAVCAAGSTRAGVLRFWFWCPPQAATLFDDPCTRTSVLGSPDALLSTDGIEPLGGSCPPPGHGALPAPTPTACVQPRADLFTNPPADPLTRRRGVLASVLLLVVVDVDGDYDAGDPASLQRLFGKVQANAIPSVVALKRVPVLENPTNHNPTPTQIRRATIAIQNGDLLGPTGLLNAQYASTDPREQYLQVNTDGTQTQRTEQFDLAWFSGFGRFDSTHTLYEETNIFTPATGSGLDQPPPVPAGADYPLPFVMVVRDGRGGEGWQVRTVRSLRP
jgi:hypothetical protein